MHRVLILGAGKIGSLTACLLAQTGEYRVHLADIRIDRARAVKNIHHLPNLQVCALDVFDEYAMDQYFSIISLDAIISCLPFYCTIPVLQLALKYHLHFFALTEDVSVTRQARELIRETSTAVVPQCGLAPGYISIVTDALIQRFDSVDTVKMRVGALPLHPSNALKYSLTWSTDGLINEYANSCQAIENRELIDLLPLEGYESIQLEGMLYEAFNTSGGLGTLAFTYAGQVRNMNYKTLRYPGHCEKITFLMKDLRLNQDRQTLKQILEHAIPKTEQDVVLIYVSVTGFRGADLYEENYVRKIYPQRVAGQVWSAIQITTSSSLCCVADLVLNDPSSFSGFVRQEDFRLADVLTNRFGCYYANAARIGNGYDHFTGEFVSVQHQSKRLSTQR